MFRVDLRADKALAEKEVESFASQHKLEGRLAVAPLVDRIWPDKKPKSYFVK